MRVAVRCPDDHPVSPGSVFAFRLGRIEEGVHNAPMGHPEVAIDEFVAGLVKQAQEEFPDHHVRVERLVDNGDGTSCWISAEEFNAEEHTPVGAGEIKDTEIHVTSEQRAGDS